MHCALCELPLQEESPDLSCVDPPAPTAVRGSGDGIAWASAITLPTVVRSEFASAQGLWMGLSETLGSPGVLSLGRYTSSLER
jgi:hypothetical protein